jgi:PAS domain S-box-containing protein
MAKIVKKEKIKSVDNPALLKIKLKSAKEVGEFAENIINTVREPLIALDKDLRVVKASQSFYDFFKVTPEETIGTLIYNLGNNQWDIPKLRELLETILPEKTTFDNFEVEHVFSTIGKRIMLLNARKIQSGSGKEQIILLAIEDITERKLAEEELAISEIRYRGLFESAKDGILILDSETGRIVDVNPILINMLGYSKEQFIDKTIWEIGIFKDIVANQDNYVEFQKKGYNRYEHLPLETKDGRRIDIEFVSHVNIAHQQKVTQCNIRDITEHKQIEELLRESEVKYRLLSELSPEMIYLFDLKGCITYINKAGGAQFRVNPSEIVGKDITDVFPPDIANQNLTAIQKVIDTKTPFYNEREMKFPFGNMWVSTRLSPVFDKEYQVVSVLGLSIDITERKQVEDALRKGEVELNEAQHLGQIGSWDFDAAMGSITRSKEYYRVYGLDPKINRNDFQEHLKTYTSESSALLDSAFKKCLKTGEGYQLDLEKTNADGTSSWITERGEVKRDDKGKIVGIRGTAQDITDRKHAELEITMLAQSLKSINECVSITDMEDKILFVNESFLKTYGFNENELVGNQMSIVRSPNNLEELVKDILPATISGGWKGEVWNKRKDGTEFPISLSTTTVCDKNGTHLGLIGVASDITERKRAENELINAKEQAESASKLKDAFIANISHEIRTPLNGILGMTALIKDIYQSNIKKEDEVLFEGIDVSSHRIIRTIDMILNYSRLHVGEFNIKPDKINISLICANLVKEFNTAAKNKSLDLSFQNNCGDTAIFADEFSISMAISNLIDNAIKFTNKGFVKLILNKGIGDEIILEVKDTGIGIDKDYLNYIFEPYRQEQMEYGRAYEGIGLGLAIVKKVLSLNKCSLNVESQKGEGSTFSIYFGKGEQPLENKSKTGIVANILPSPEKLRKVLVLLVEDDLMNQVTIKKFIENRYNVIVTDSSDEALEILKKKKVDIILMDISIRGKKNGLELTKELKESKEFSHIPVIAVTAHAFEADRQNALKAGCDSYLAKPFTKESLLNMIANYAHK